MEQEPGSVAVVCGSSDQVQELFAAVSSKWRSAGIRVAGVLAESHNLPDRSCAAGILRNIASGERFRIYLDTAPDGTSCHLDADGVESACASILEELPQADVVVLSKFGKLEAEGKGLWPAFRACLAAGKPVVTTVSGKHRETWQAFMPDAETVDADAAALTAWRSRAG